MLLQFIARLIARFLVYEFIRFSGIVVRWSFVSLGHLSKGRKVTPFHKYHMKMTHDNDPSNRMSDGIIHMLLGVGTWVGITILFFAVA